MECKNCKTTISIKWRKRFCASCYHKRWRENNYQYVSDYLRDVQVRYRRSKVVARRRKLEWSLSLEEFANLCNKPCHYCNNKLGKITSTGCGLDRIDNDMGYITGNILSCCESCNIIRSNLLSVDEMMEVAKLIIKLRNV